MKQLLKNFLKILVHNIIKYILKTRPNLLQPYLSNIDEDRDMAMNHFITTLANCSDTSNINVCFNDSKLFVPAQTLLTMTHCITFENSTIVCRVEQKHFMWLYEQVREFKGQTLFIDIGSASGAAVMTLAPRIPGLRTIAFEPSRKARTLLERMVLANNISAVTIYPFAVSDTVAELPFIEYGHLDGAPAYRPETSSLFIPSALTPDAETYKVSCITLDHMFSDTSQTHDFSTQVIIKIDVEGFECHVLRGAEKYIKHHQPFLAIDIHSRPENPSETTRQECLVFLRNMGYSVQIMDHVLVAQPKPRGK
jgi:FkbM family methyltransferase